MKLALLITGQIRDQAIFADLCQALARVGHSLAAIAYASWPEQLAIGKKIAAEKAPSLEITYVDCGVPLPVSGKLHRDITSFLAQHHQLALGLEKLGDENTYVMRVRADMANAHMLGRLAEMVASYAKDERLSTHSVIFGAAGSCPFFFEDRILILSPKHAKKLVGLTLNQVYRYNPFNIFPEFVIYSTISVENQDILRYDLRFRERYGIGKRPFTTYDFALFSDRYSNFVEDYKRVFSSNFVFFDDLFGDDDIYREIAGLVPRFHAWYSKDNYFNNLNDDISSYESQYKHHNTGNTDYTEALSCSSLFANIYIHYVSAENAAVVAMREQILDMPLFQHEAKEMLGCSFCVIGQKNEAEDVLSQIFEQGYRGFECLYYLCNLMFEKSDSVGLEKYCAALRDAHRDNPRAIAHADYLTTRLSSILELGAAE